MRYLTLASVTFSTFALMASASAQNLTAMVRAKIEASPTLMIGDRKIDVDAVKKLYSLRNYNPMWVNQKGLVNVGEDLKMTLEDAEIKGLKTSYYLPEDMEARISSQETNNLVDLEILMTQAYVRYAKDISTGRTNPQDASQGLDNIELPKQPFPAKAYQVLNEFASQNDIIEGLRAIEPRTNTYAALLKALNRLLIAKSYNDWTTMAVVGLRPGASHPNVVAIRKKMVDHGILDAQFRKVTSPVYDNTLVRAVVRFQEIHNLSADGVIGAKTYEVLNVSLSERIAQINANLERWRLLPKNMGDKFLLVDLGRQELDVMDNNQLVGRMKVVVGQELRSTPTMIDEIPAVIVRPYWNAPSSIVVKDIIPAMQKNPYYLEDTRMKVIGVADPSRINWSQYTLENRPPYQFRQDPGEHNSLGVLKFDLAKNKHAIYLHDTNHKEKFAESIRYFSSGCIRLENPIGLAQYLLADQGYSLDYIRQITSDETILAQRVKLTQPMKVYVVGSTVTMRDNGFDQDDGQTAFTRDVYKDDANLQRALDIMN